METNQNNQTPQEGPVVQFEHQLSEVHEAMKHEAASLMERTAKNLRDSKTYRDVLKAIEAGKNEAEEVGEDLFTTIGELMFNEDSKVEEAVVEEVHAGPTDHEGPE